jgi:hypothetical protein
MSININIDKCIENFIKDCADVCTVKQVNSFIDAVGEELSLSIYKKYCIHIFKFNSVYLFIDYNEKEYLIKFDRYTTATYLFGCIGFNFKDCITIFTSITSADFIYNEPEMEQDGYVYNFAYKLSADGNSSISVIDAKTRERILSIGNTLVYYTKLFLKRFPSITNDELANYYLPERIKQKIMAIKIMNTLKE